MVTIEDWLYYLQDLMDLKIPKITENLIYYGKKTHICYIINNCNYQCQYWYHLLCYTTTTTTTTTTHSGRSIILKKSTENKNVLTIFIVCMKYDVVYAH